MNDLIGTLGFLTVFHLIGGLALGGTIRSWVRHRFSCRDLFLIFWGAMFGGLPLIMGIPLFLSHGAPLLAAVEVAILVGTIVVAVLVPDWFLEAYSGSKLIPLAMGGLFFLIGIAIGFAMFKEQPLTAFLFFFAFAGAGGLLLVTSMHAILKP